MSQQAQCGVRLHPSFQFLGVWEALPAAGWPEGLGVIFMWHLLGFHKQGRLPVGSSVTSEASSLPEPDGELHAGWGRENE